VNLFGKARRALGGGRPSADLDAPQAYRVSCPEGHVLSGQRTEGYQAIRCPACGEGVFILPRSPLPIPPAPVAQRARRRRVVQPVAEGPIELMDAPAEVELAPPPPEVEIQWEEDAPSPTPRTEPGPAEPTRPASRKGTAAARSASPPPKPARPAPRPPQPAAERAIEIPYRPSIRERIHRRRHALAVLGVVALVIGTIGVRMLRSYWESLPKIAAANREEGLQALEGGEFDVAKRKLDIAATALERLDDPDAPIVRQAADEAAILADLARGTLEEIVEKVATSSDGPSQFRTLHRGRSIILDAHIEAPHELDYQILASGKRARIALEGFSLLDGKRPGDAVTFGARLASISLGDDNVWQIELEPESGVFISTPSAWKALEALGWPSRIAPVNDPSLQTEPAGDPGP
jgi:hypothetical protein